MGIEVNFSGLENRLNQLGKKASKELTDKALNQGAKIILKEQQKNVPVDTGKLKESLEISKPKNSGVRKLVYIGIPNSDDKKAKYGYYQEYGTRHMVGKKWMIKSWQNSIRDANKAIKEVIVNEILK